MTRQARNLFLGALLLAAGCAEGDGWIEQELGTDAEFRDVFFLDAERGWIVGGGIHIRGGLLGSTVDGGKTWRFRSGLVDPSSRASSFHLNAIQFLDESTGIIAADGGFILRTVDGGESWYAVARGPRVSSHLFDVHFVDDLHGWVVGGSRLLRTTDGGSHWFAPIPHDAPQDFSGKAIQFLDPQNGWAVGGAGRILRTTDGGETWARMGGQAITGKPNLTAVSFPDPDHGWTVGENGTILRTADGGLTWSRQNSGTSRRLSSVHFVDASTGWAIGFARTDSASVVLQTEDGGVVWEPRRRVEGEALLTLFFTDASHGWAVGERVRPSEQKLLRYDPGPPR